MVRHQDGICAVFAAQPGVLAGLDALQHELHFRQLPYAAHPAPDGGGRVCSTEDAVQDRLGQPGGHIAVEACRVARAGPAVAAPVSDDRFAVVPGKHVDGPHQHGAAAVFDPPHQLFRLVPTRGHVELEPRRRTQRFCDVLEFVRASRSEHLEGLLRPGRPRHGQFAVRVVYPLQPDGAEKDRRIPDSAENFGACIDLADIHEAPGLELIMVEAFQVCLDGGVVIHAAGHETPVGGA